MKRINEIGIIILGALLLGACGMNKSGIEVVSEPTAKVYLNGVESGSTPYKNLNLKPGEITLKLIEGGKSWERKINLENNVTSVINWNLEKNNGSGYILSMEKNGSLGSILISSDPGGAMVYVDGEIKNSTPCKIEGLESGDRKVSISYPGYKSLNLIVKMIKGYQLVIESKLEKEFQEIVVDSTPTPTKSLMIKVLIKETETGWLKVRKEANSGAMEIGKVRPGEKYDFLGEENGWDKILFNNQEAWISAKYAEKISE